MDNTNISWKVVVITGASSGLGEATALHLGALGAAVVLGARRADRIDAIAKDVQAAGGKAIALPTDVTDAQQVKTLVDQAVQAFGRVDVVINNAGLMPHSPLERLKIADWDRMIDVNIKGVLYGIAAALPHMKQQMSGQIINVSSVAGHKVGPAARSTRPPSTRCARCRRAFGRRSSRTTSARRCCRRAPLPPSFHKAPQSRTSPNGCASSTRRMPSRPIRSRGPRRLRDEPARGRGHQRDPVPADAPGTVRPGMTKIQVLGANGQLARNTTPFFLKHDDVQLTLYLRRASRLKNPDAPRVRIVEGDVLDRPTLEKALQGQDVVYANLAGDMARQAGVIVDAMNATNVKRLIFISSMGIYGEVPGEPYRNILDPYRDSAAVIEASDLGYTIGWFNQDPEIDDRLTQKGEPFKGHDVSLNSLSDLIVKLALDPALERGHSIGVSNA